MSRSLGSIVRASRWLMAGAVVVGLVVLFAIFLGGVELFRWTESTSFCSSCHVMKPEVTAYRGSPHSRIDCGTCHVGPGAIPAVQAKLAAIRYLYRLPLNLFERPIPSPITSLRPVEVVCEQCHWPQKFYDDRLAVLSRYAPDENNSLTKTALALHTGGGPGIGNQTRGIHWHITNPVYYIATDEKRQDIPWVQAEFNGKVTTYVSSDSKLTPEQIATTEKRKMDCVDCHNRATHVFSRPSDAIDAAMAAGAIPADLPFIKQQGVAVLEMKYTTEDQAAKAIAGVEDFYKTKYADLYGRRQADVKAAVAGLQTIFDSDQFPFMNVTWESHPNNIGHRDFPGCFRCHDGKHLSSDNQAIRLECNVCHTVPQVAAPGKLLPALPVSKGPEPDSHRSTTWLSEHRSRFDASCAACHTIENPGGSDNSSFCSNSACHASAWKFARLDAPQVRGQNPAPANGQPPAVPHPIGARTDCKICHGPDKVRPFPANHAGYTIDTCTGCHKPTLQDNGQPVAPTSAPAATPAAAATSAPAAGATTVPAIATTAPAAATTAPAAPAGGIPPIPHTVAGRENCLLCHNPAGALAPAPAAPQDHVGRTIETCQGCHKPA